ncbi:MFS transporter [Pedobacter sp. UYEF25]
MKTLSKLQVFIMAFTAGIAVANVYYSQPILEAIAHSLNIPIEKAGSISVLSQVGYGLGLFFLTPIGDMIDRKKLILYLQLLLIASLLLFAFSTNILLLFLASVLVGTFAVVAQVVLPMAASLIDENRGKVVAQIFTGLLIGILTARVFSGFITHLWGWKYVYIIGALFVGITTVLMQTDFPSAKVQFSGTYRSLLKSTIAQLGRFPALRAASITGMLSFGTLSAFWITLTLHLSGEPFLYNPSTIGLFGLLAVVGAVIAPVFGKIADNGGQSKSLIFSTGIVVLSVVVLFIFPASVIAIAAVVILLDMGVQGAQVTNISIIYNLDARSNSRINTVYMTAYFIGGSTSAFLSIEAYKMGGWMYSVIFMGILSILAVVNVLISRKNPK